MEWKKLYSEIRKFETTLNHYEGINKKQRSKIDYYFNELSKVAKNNNCGYLIKHFDADFISEIGLSNFRIELDQKITTMSNIMEFRNDLYKLLNYLIKNKNKSIVVFEDLNFFDSYYNSSFIQYIIEHIKNNSYDIPYYTIISDDSVLNGLKKGIKKLNHVINNMDYYKDDYKILVNE